MGFISLSRYCSDGDMYTLSYSFKPWDSEELIPSGETILNYILKFPKKIKSRTIFGPITKPRKRNGKIRITMEDYGRKSYDLLL